ncbi:hypothetical protein [Acidithiobacillus sulfurivorans]|uniref:MADF domain-containing protein n=1 Tax=Acidithiobacillus sulfurivorans TaxID=1958756 RepID=A0ABS6A1H5_9PROT|nr:hypothetical protein [Acidithiobacillus sulfurivorans]MBU2760966.1 hypothetical protein [Acidithiobacillus sulfurivorans]
MDSASQRTVTSPASGGGPLAGCNPDKTSTLVEWQAAYDRYFTYYAQMSPEYMEAKESDYRTRNRGVRWAHQMVEASLGTIWQKVYAKTPTEKREKFWGVLKAKSIFLEDGEGFSLNEDTSDESSTTPSDIQQQVSLF